MIRFHCADISLNHPNITAHTVAVRENAWNRIWRWHMARYFNIKFDGDVESILCFIFRHSSENPEYLSTYPKIECRIVDGGVIRMLFYALASIESMEKKEEENILFFFTENVWNDSSISMRPLNEHVRDACIWYLLSAQISGNSRNGIFASDRISIPFLPHRIKKKKKERKKCRLMN